VFSTFEEALHHSLSGFLRKRKAKISYSSLAENSVLSRSIKKMLYASSKECLMYPFLQKVHTCINMFSKMYFYTFISYAEMSLEVWNRLLCVYINAYLVGAYSYLQV
jgi:hypothetical protein